MNIKENNGAIFLKFYGPIFSNCVSLEMLSKYNEIVFPFALLSQQSPALWPSCGRINLVLEFTTVVTTHLGLMLPKLF
jgi:hypothetical protein